MTHTGSNDGLRQQDFVPLAIHGWGDAWNAYVHSMAWFEGYLFCGTFRGTLCIKRRQKSANLPWPVWPVKCPDAERLYDEIDLCAEIWRFDPRTTEWKRVMKSPVVPGNEGFPAPRDLTYRGMGIFQGPSDPKPALYVSGLTPRYTPGPWIFRSLDGESFEAVSTPGLGLEGISSFRFLVPFRDKLYTSPIGGAHHVMNFARVPVVLESDDPAQGQWRAVSEPGFGDPNNLVVFNLCEFNDHLYAGTANAVSGLQLWKTDARGDPPYQWHKVIDRGAFRGNLNEGVASMCVFNGALYVGTGIQEGGYDRANRIGPAGGEVLRVFPDDSWEVLVGESRLTAQGMKVSRSGLGPGFGEFFNGYIWRMCAHDGRLYVGTFDWSLFMRYTDYSDWPDLPREWASAIAWDRLNDERVGFELWSTADGEHWTPVSVSGFDNRYNSGIRNLVSTPYGLAVGTANVMGPEVAVNRNGAWSYELNPRGGCEVWLGAAEMPESIRLSRPAGSQPDDARPAEAYRPSVMSPAAVEPKPVVEAVDFDSEVLADLDARVDPTSVLSHTVDKLCAMHRVGVQGSEYVPAVGAALLVVNNPATPISSLLGQASQHTLILLREVRKIAKRAARMLATPAHYGAGDRVQLTAEMCGALGFVPDTPHNAEQLLRKREIVLAFPERTPSGPGYELREFDDSYVRLAAVTGAPIVPTIILGPYESRVVIERDDRLVVANQGMPVPVRYQIIFLKPVRIRTKHLEDSAVRVVNDDIRTRMTEVIAHECARRPMVTASRGLQRRFGGSEHGRMSSALPVADDTEL